MKVCVIIGCEGTLGQQIVSAKLLNPEVLVVGYDRSDSSNFNHSRFKYVSGDVSNRSDLFKLKTEIKKIQTEQNLGNSLDCIINSFAAMDHKYLSEDIPVDADNLNWMLWGWQNFPDEDFLEQYNTNVVGVHKVLTTLYECYKDSHSCSIINFSSQYAKRNLNQEIFKNLGHFVFKPPAYSASKAALENYTEYLSQVFQGSGVRINSIAPGVIDSGQSDRFKEEYAKTTFKGRLMNPSEIIGAIEFLTSEQSAYMTGSCLTIDGGWSVK
jgi:NAD(P)-dependent dehydrogenase (short-subunit alcohol dehydrogenase family)